MIFKASFSCLLAALLLMIAASTLSCFTTPVFVSDSGPAVIEDGSNTASTSSVARDFMIYQGSFYWITKEIVAYTAKPPTGRIIVQDAGRPEIPYRAFGFDPLDGDPFHRTEMDHCLFLIEFRSASYKWSTTTDGVETSNSEFALRIPLLRWSGGVFLGLILMDMHRRQKRTAQLNAESICRKCGYDLRASSIRCPECGEGIPLPDEIAKD